MLRCILNLAGLGAIAIGGAMHSVQASLQTSKVLLPDQRACVERGLAALAQLQRDDGSFSGDGLDRHVGVTSLAGIAFMQAGNLPGRGPYGDNVQRALEFIVSSSQESGLIVATDRHGAMYGHGFATLFLAEAYGMTRQEAIGDVLKRAVELIEKSQSPTGGWRYQPFPMDADISVTICQVMALRAARDAGIKVRGVVIDRAIRYVRDCQNTDGGFSYMARQGGPSGFARSAAGLATLYYAGVSDGSEVERALQYLIRARDGSLESAKDAHGHFFYGHYYASQAMFLAGDDYWKAWFPSLRDELLRAQLADGLWRREVSPAYSTAMSLIILQMPNRYLPVYTGKGRGS
jgi:hypothetical protein